MPEAHDNRLRLAVVGHTNTGKTSLLRTLTRNPGFGQVQDSPGTTRHVEGARLLVEGKCVVELFDTPGMEDGIGLLDYINRLAEHTQRLDGPDRIRRFLDSPESKHRYEQEARVVRKLLECDAGLYVVDVRDPVLGKHKDELAILAACGRPLLPVLNFIRSPIQHTGAWRETLARLGLHAIAEFDTVAPALDGEIQLYEKLGLLLDTHAALLQTLKADVLQQRRIRRADAARLIAELLIDAAAYRLSSLPDDSSLKQATQTLRSTISKRETDCVRALLKRYNFNTGDFPNHPLPLEGERWGMDLFHPQALKDAGLHMTKGIAAGAMAGATVDLFTAGLSLGAAALVGAAAGGLWQGMDRYGKRIMGRLKGQQEISVDDAVLCLLALRQTALVRALDKRGHAAQAPISLESNPPMPGESSALQNASRTEHASPPAPPANTFETELRKGRLPAALEEARAHTEWSMLTRGHGASPRREQLVRELASDLDAMQHAGGRPARHKPEL